MKAIILAAGEGTRLKKYTGELPKGMLRFRGRTLIEHQIGVLRECGIDPVCIVRGFCGHKINYEGVRNVDNPLWQHTNMVESLMCARSEFDDDVVITYADVWFTTELLREVASSAFDIAVAVDTDWRTYWQRRYGRIDVDTESLELTEDGLIASLGRPNPPLEDIDGRYIGVMKFSRAALAMVVEVYEEAKASAWGRPWQQSGRPFQQAYMTDLLQELIDRGQRVHAVTVKGGWLEFDTNEDFERQRDLATTP